MYSYNYPKDMTVGRVCLEMSLKPFKQLDDAYIDTVCRGLFDKWRPLLQYATGVSVMFWTSDGSEILDYSGNLDDEFEWGRYIGIGNPKKVKRIPGTIWDDDRFLHVKPVIYTEHPPVMHYRDLQRILAAVKRVGKEMTGFDVTVGETFDPGPEFAYSEFKFERHAELNKGDCMDAWIHCAGKLHGDSRRYAAYPEGIPEGTVFGEFLSRQFACLKKDVGFDYLWLSNGFGFSLNSWNWKGELFDGSSYNFEGAEEVRRSIKEFWDTYTPNTDFVTDVRGSNLSTGMDISAHGCPIDEIYKNNIVAPPNSPWAALDSRFGLELVGYMSHMAQVPKNGYGFRYYTHDPWWINSPWFDRYGRSPHDIYLPLAVTRMNEQGHTEKPCGINLLSVDDSFGEIPERCSNEVIPHILEGYRTYPDAPGFVTWLYPFEDYCRLGLKEGRMERMMMDDWLVEAAVDVGLPVNTVVSDKTFLQSDSAPYRHTILMTPVPEEGSLLEACVWKALDAGIPLMLYGSTEYASEKLRNLLGVALDKELEGDFRVETSLYRDTYQIDRPSDVLAHRALVSNGGIREVSGEKGTEILCRVHACDGSGTRVYASCNRKARLVWVRGSFPHISENTGSLPGQRPLSRRFNPALLLRGALQELGLTLYFSAYSTSDKLPLVLASEHRGYYYFTNYSKDETVQTHIGTPIGAPCIEGTTFFVENSIAAYSLPKCLHAACRAFVRQKEKSKISCFVATPGDAMHMDRRIVIRGLQHADLTVLPEKDSHMFFYLDADDGDYPEFHVGDSNVAAVCDENGYYVLKNITGKLIIGWQSNETTREYIRLGYLK